MSHLQHIIRKKPYLEARSRITRLVREFFWSNDFLEMETPIILRLPGQEPYLSPMPISLHNERGERYDGYLHTSPEYTMKKMLAAGFEKIFSLCKVFRDGESFGGTHNPEFTMIEWYRANADMFAIMDDVEKIFQYLSSEMRNNESTMSGQVVRWSGGQVQFERLHMRDAWKQYAGVNLDDALDADSMRTLCLSRGYKPNADEPFEDLFYRIFLNEIEPHLGKDTITILHHYPAQMAALSRLSPANPQYAERFEVYAGGMELANCFSELVDPIEQRRRLIEDRERRKELGKAVFPIDENFINAVGNMPPSAGIALGIDRLVMLLLGCKDIDDVLALPASELYDQP